jgi:hypothetical protein
LRLVAKEIKTRIEEMLAIEEKDEGIEEILAIGEKVSS